MEIEQVRKRQKKNRKLINMRVDQDLIEFIEKNKLSPTLIFVTAVKELIAKQKK